MQTIREIKDSKELNHMIRIGKKEKRKGSYLKTIENEIMHLERRKRLTESMWTNKIKEALITVPTDEMVHTKKSMMSQKTEDLEKIQSDLDFWQEELSQERKRPQPPHRLLKRKIKKRSDTKAEALILEYINRVAENPKLSVVAMGPAVAKEKVAYDLELPVSQVENIFRKLNREGIISQRNHRYAHDTNRNPIFYGSDSGWASDYYMILNQEKKENDNEKDSKCQGKF